MDIYSRKIVGWEVYENESSEQAADVLRKTRLKEALPINHELVLHSDNGGPMKGCNYACYDAENRYYSLF